MLVFGIVMVLDVVIILGGVLVFGTLCILDVHTWCIDWVD